VITFGLARSDPIKRLLLLIFFSMNWILLKKSINCCTVYTSHCCSIMRVKKLHEHGLSKDTRVTIIFILEKNIIFLANVEFKPGGQSAALQLVLRPLGLFVIEKKHYKNQINAKNYKKCMIFLSISIKNYPKREKGHKKFN